jgi:hypothetical protein
MPPSEMEASADTKKISSRSPIWPVLIAPLVAIAYYAALKSAFSISIVSALGEDATADVVEDTGAWGSHWIYRLAAEILSVGLGTFVAAGLARGRERAAAIIGALTIALGFVLFWSVFLIFRDGYTSLISLNLDNYTPDAAFARLIFTIVMTLTVGLINLRPEAEPWYQHAIAGLIVIAAPVIATYVSEIAKQLNVRHPIGFVGINRLHLIWLWFAAFCYALGLIDPVSRLLTRPRGAFDLLTGILTGIPTTAIPVILLLVPGYYGLALLSGHKGSNLHWATRNLLGVIVLVAGFLIVAGLSMFFQKD